MPLPPIAPPLPRTVRLAQTGDASAREELALYCRKTACIFALQGVGDQHEAQDLAQDAVLRFFAALDRFHTDRPVKPWLLTILRNLIRDRARRRRTRRIEALSLDDAIVEPCDPVPGPESIAALHQMQQLPDDQWREAPRGGVSRTGRTVGWSLAIVWLIIITGFGLFQGWQGAAELLVTGTAVVIKEE